MEIININEIVPTKSNIELVATSLTSNVIDGNINPLEFLVKCKFLEEVLKDAQKKVKNIALDKIDKSDSILGAKIEVAETGTKYYYEECYQWNDINEKIEPLLELQKKIEDDIKIATKLGKVIADGETGEVISPVTKKSTTSLKITLGK